MSPLGTPVERASLVKHYTRENYDIPRPIMGNILSNNMYEVEGCLSWFDSSCWDLSGTCIP